MDNAKPTRRSPVRPRRSRATAEALLVSVAVDLLNTRDPDDITVREIAALAHVNTRFIGEWFGGKVGLFAAAHRSIVDRQSGSVDERDAIEAVPPEVVQRTVRLAVWLVSKGGLASDATEVFPSLGRLIDRFIKDFNLTERQARIAVFQIAAVMNFEAMVRPHADILVSFDEVVAQHFETLVLLGKTNPSSNG